MSFTAEESEAVTEKINAMIADSRVALLDPLQFSTKEKTFSARSFRAPNAQKRTVDFAASAQLFDNTGQTFDVTFTGFVESTVILAGTTIDRVVVNEPEELKSRQNL